MVSLISDIWVADNLGEGLKYGGLAGYLSSITIPGLHVGAEIEWHWVFSSKQGYPNEGKPILKEAPH